MQAKFDFAKLVSQALKKEWPILLLLCFLAFWLRLKGITSTPTDWHAFRQADTASVTREFVKQGIDLLRPKYQDLSNIQSGKDNLLGYRMVEFPFVNALTALFLLAIPQLDLVFFSRFVSVIFSLGTTVCLYYLGKRWSGQWVGIAAAFTFAVLPYARYYSRAILPESPYIFFVTCSICCFQLWLSTRQKKFYAITAVSLALAMLLKPFVLFLGPLFFWMALQKYKIKIWKQWDLWVLALLGVAPFWAWRDWIKNYPQGIPASDWLFNSDGIRFRPAWFRWLFFERMTKLILGWTGWILFLAGLVPSKKVDWINYWIWWICMFIYMAVIATGNVRHDYYQVFLLPIICLTVGKGMVAFTHWKWPLKISLPSQVKAGITVFILLLSSRLAWNYIGPYYRTRPDWEKAGQAADRLLPPNAKVIAPAFGDTAFLFQTNRTGWPIGFEIDKKIELGAEYYVTTSYDQEAKELEKEYPVIEKTDDYLILKLKK
jgi:hypothetical protein